MATPPSTSFSHSVKAEKRLQSSSLLAQTQKPSTISDSDQVLPSSATTSTAPDVIQDHSDQDFEDFIDAKIKEITDKGFSPLPRGIGQPQAVEFYKTILSANNEVLSILEHGYMPRWKHSPPPPSSMANNKSAASEMPFVRDTVQEWLEKGYVMKLSEPATVNAPLSVASKYDVMTGTFLVQINPIFPPVRFFLARL